jgi:hypothetical protein
MLFVFQSFALSPLRGFETYAALGETPARTGASSTGLASLLLWRRLGELRYRYNVKKCAPRFYKWRIERLDKYPRPSVKAST